MGETQLHVLGDRKRTRCLSSVNASRYGLTVMEVSMTLAKLPGGAAAAGAACSRSVRDVENSAREHLEERAPDKTKRDVARDANIVVALVLIWLVVRTRRPKFLRMATDLLKCGGGLRKKG